MQCPFCKAEDTRVIDSREAEEGAQVRRRRECEKCGQRFTTIEKAQLDMPMIVKRDSPPEPFDEEKLRKGFERALYKRPVAPEAVDHAIEKIKQRARTNPSRQVESRRLGDWVMEELRDMDQVAYVRFASIYRQFQDANAFREEVERLLAFPTAEQRRSQLPLIENDGGAGDSGLGTPEEKPPEPKKKVRS